MNEEQKVPFASEEKVPQLTNYKIELSDDGYYLSVEPASKEALQSTEPLILAALRERKIKNLNTATVIRTLREASGSRVKIAPPPEPEAEPDIMVLVARDRMEASLQIKVPANCRDITLDEVYQKINQAGVVYGIEHDQVAFAFNRPGIRVTFAKGLPPVDGQDAYLKFHVETEDRGRPAELEHGRVDFKNLNLFTNVKAGQLLAEKIPPTAGTPGIDITNLPAQAKPGKDMPLPLGKHVKPGETDNNQIVAEIAGQYVRANGKLNVIPVIEIKEDVDLSTGNIEFDGSVIIRGSVQNGFSIKAGGDVEVYGTVSGGIVEGKNVIIRTGIQGMNTGYVKALENITAKYIENATVTAGGNVHVFDVILHSHVSAGKRVILESGRGQITGGRIAAGEEIRAKTVGTHLSPSTDLEVGINPLLREEYVNLRKEYKKTEISFDQTQKGLLILRSMDQQSMPEDKKQMLLKLTKAQFQLAAQLESMRFRIAEIDTAFEEMKMGRIRIADTVYPGIKIMIGSMVKPIREATRFVTFYAEDGEIKTGPYK